MEFKIKIDDEQENNNKKLENYSSAEEKVKNDDYPVEGEKTSEKNVNENNKKAQNSNTSIFHFDYYFTLFDVDGVEVGKRIMYSFLPVKASFFPLIETNPDLYGPFWICTTLIFLIAASGNLSLYLNEDDKTKFIYNFNLIPIAACLIYSYGFLIPLILFSMVRWFNMTFTYMQILCIYGYSLSCFLPIVVICILPYDLLKWLVLTYAVVNSALFLLINIWKETSTLHTKSKYILLGVVLTLQLALLLMFKLFFFSKLFSN